MFLHLDRLKPYPISQVIVQLLNEKYHVVLFLSEIFRLD